MNFKCLCSSCKKNVESYRVGKLNLQLRVFKETIGFIFLFHSKEEEW